MHTSRLHFLSFFLLNILSLVLPFSDFIYLIVVRFVANLLWIFPPWSFGRKGDPLDTHTQAIWLVGKLNICSRHHHRWWWFPTDSFTFLCWFLLLQLGFFSSAIYTSTAVSLIACLLPLMMPFCKWNLNSLSKWCVITGYNFATPKHIFYFKIVV